MEARRRIVIAGGGIAGLTAALAFAQRGFAVDIFEQAERIEAVGAGLQLSPNATRILVRLGVLERLLPSAVRPEAVVLRDAAALKELARVPLGSSAEQRWQAPYLTAHRADLQDALVAQAGATAGIRLVTGARITSVETGNDGVTARIERDGKTDTAQADLAVGADGVWSAMRRRDGLAGNSRFTGELAWRTTVKVESAAGRLFATLSTDGCVNAFLNPHFHLIAYPVSAGAAINLVAFTKGERIAEGWSGRGDPSILAKAMNGAAPGLRQLIDAAGPWLAWPLHAVDQRAAWTDPAGIALIGDAAHAMTPFAAQGAGMAIEDAATLAASVAETPGAMGEALARWELQRKPRVAKVTRRGALNHMAWNAAGPVALARNMVLKLRSGERLAADLDWLYGWQAP
ncbi:salicylate hydroxylase [Mesorhizobium sp. YL-MeA3-2017]|nr:salicylate hydroxylase [Mesorhizobium sp. YL-MeA3-2017]